MEENLENNENIESTGKKLTSAQRKELSKAAQTLKPFIQIGQNGVGDSNLAKIEETLNAHELIKIKFLEFKDEKIEIIEEICRKLDAALVRVIGNVAIIYRPCKEVEKRKFGILI